MSRSLGGRPPRCKICGCDCESAGGDEIDFCPSHKEITRQIEPSALHKLLDAGLLSQDVQHDKPPAAKLTPACAACKRSKKRCSHRRELEPGKLPIQLIGHPPDDIILLLHPLFSFVIHHKTIFL
jgi:hypothetical protein